MTKEKLRSSSGRIWLKSFPANFLLKAPAGSVDGSLFVYELASFTAGEIKRRLMPLKQQLGGRWQSTPRSPQAQQEQDPVKVATLVDSTEVAQSMCSALTTWECGCGVILLWCRASRGRWTGWKGEALGKEGLRAGISSDNEPEKKTQQNRSTRLQELIIV